MPLPNLIIPGAQKAGTTSLRAYLNQHPDVYLAPEELHYFDLNYDKPIEEYEENFKRREEKIIGEKSPLYLYDPSVPKRIHETIPETQLIILLRDPVKRAYSHYWHEIRKEREKETFEEAIETEEEKREKLNFQEKINLSYIDRGKYSEQIERYLEYFERDQMLIKPAEDLFYHPKDTLKDITKFLDLEKFEFQKIKPKNFGGAPLCSLIKKLRNNRAIEKIPIVNKGFKFLNRAREKPPMDKEIKEELAEKFKPYNEELIQYIDFDPSEKWENF